MTDPRQFSDVARQVVRWSDEHGLDGVLFFAGTGAVVDPWVAAGMVLAESRLLPVIAANPVYMPPYTAAQMIASFAHLYGRKVALNLITGTALSDLNGMGDTLTHDQRYERLGEYASILRRLLDSVRPVSFRGRFYTTSGLQITPGITEELRPDYFCAGSSAAAERISEQAGAALMQMLPPTLDRLPTGRKLALNLGIVTRPTATEAEDAAHQYFPPDDDLAAVATAAMDNTDSVWKRKLFESATDAPKQYWLSPIRNFHADCPYYVDGYAGLAHLVRRLRDKGVTDLIIDLPPSEEEFAHLMKAMSMARQEQR